MDRLLTLPRSRPASGSVHIAVYLLNTTRPLPVVERVSFAAGFGVAAAGALLGLAAFVLAERRVAGPPVLPRPAAGV